jgi:hypothetical protein
MHFLLEVRSGRIEVRSVPLLVGSDRERVRPAPRQVKSGTSLLNSVSLDVKLDPEGVSRGRD